MNYQRLNLLVMVLLLATGLAACGAPATAAPTSTPILAAGPTATLPAAPTAAASATPAPTQTAAASTASACANAYFPLSPGSTWAYSSTGSIAGDYTFNRTLSDQSDTGFTTQDAFSTGVTRFLKWSCDSGNLAALNESSTSATVSTKTTTMTADTVNATGYTIPNAFTDGKTWSEDLSIKGTLMRGSNTLGTGVSEDKVDCTDAGSESVTVPVGTFDTVKMTCHSNLVTTATVSGITGDPVTTVEDTTQWYAQGVGMVKMTSSGDGGNETIVLTSYKIP